LAHCPTAALGYAAKSTSNPSLLPVRRIIYVSHHRDYMLFHAFRGLGEDGDFVYFRVPRRRRSCPGAAKEPEWAAGTRRHRRDDSSSVAHRAKEEVSSRVAASLRRIGSADPSPRLGSWSRVAPRLPQKTLKSRRFPPAAFCAMRFPRVFGRLAESPTAAGGRTPVKGFRER
jgi:hypothetical protein